MQNCLGIYIENNLLKYAKVSKDKTDFKVEAYGVEFFDNADEAISKVIEETYSFNIPITINLTSEKYLYYDLFALLSKNDLQKSVETEFEAYCDENKYNQNAFETRYALVPNAEDKEKIKAIQVIVNKIELNKQKQTAEKYKLTKIAPIGIAIANISKLEKNENTLIINMEEKTTITTIYNRQVYNVEILDHGSQEILEKINKIENSMSKAYEICKDTTIYTSDVIDDVKDQPYLEYIVPVLYELTQKVKEIIESTSIKFSTIYLTGTLANINNVDLYFQEFFTNIDCKIMKPAIIDENVTQVNMKDYIEVNSAIALAMFGLGEGVQPLNFKKMTVLDKIGQLSSGEKPAKSEKAKGKPGKKIDLSFKGNFDKTETMLLKASLAFILIMIIFIIFSKMLYSQMNSKQTEIEGLISKQKSEITRVNNDKKQLDQKNEKYKELTEEVKAINDKISNIAQRRNSIPNLLNQIMYVIPESVQLTSIENATGDKITIIAQADDYDQLGYFIAKIKLEGYLKNVISSSGQKNGDIVSVSIEGDLP